MARSVRIEYPGAVYHMMCRGDRKEPIFDSDRDRREFMRTLGEACERTGFLVHGYVLMSNHYHLLLETPSGNLVSGMKWFQGTYTQRYNSANGKSGHLFQGRYKAIPLDCEDSGYFRCVSDYIHLNPARAGLLRPEDALDAGMAGKRRDSYESGGMRGYDEREAERLLSRALDQLGVNLEDVRARRQADAVKQAIAWWIKSQTVVGDAWLCRELQMGHRVNVSRAVKRYRALADAEAREIRKMFICTD